MIIHKMKTLSHFTFTLILLITAFIVAQNMEMPFNADWRFAKGEQVEQVLEIDFNDSDWQPARLPHDWAIGGPFFPKNMDLPANYPGKV